MKRWGKFFYLILFIHFVVCAAAASTHVGSNQDKITKKKSPAEEVAAVEVTVENSYESPLDKSPDIKIINAPAGAKDEKEIIVEEGNGDQKQNLLNTALDFYQASQELWSRGELKEAINALDEAYSLILSSRQVKGLRFL